MQIVILDVEVDHISERTHVHVLDYLVEVALFVEATVESDNIRTVRCEEYYQIFNELVAALFLVDRNLLDGDIDFAPFHLVGCQPNFACRAFADPSLLLNSGRSTLMRSGLT